jgi:D-tyrosyl-tRNA(Tyr) deacylase
MRAVIQRVKEASVKIEGHIFSRIGKGLLVLLGVEENDAENDAEMLAGKISRLRIFDDAQGVMNLSVKEVDGEILTVSQFTLHAGTKKGNRPSYIKAAKPEKAVALYEHFIRCLQQETVKEIKTGKFRAMMDVSLVNDGPVTIIIDTKNWE